MNTNNTVELIGTYGGDETHALSAWTSTARDLDEVQARPTVMADGSVHTTKRTRIPHLLKMLADDGHGTPFEKSFIHFLVTTDIASHIHLLKHRIGVSVNSESARYKELMEDKIYVPTDWPANERIAYIQHAQLCFSRYHETLDRLVAQGVPRKRAKESARFYLPYGMQYTADVAFNFRSFYHFVKLRYSTHAQEEIREIARCMLQAVHETGKFDLTLQAFGLVKDGKLIKPFGGKKK